MAKAIRSFLIFILSIGTLSQAKAQLSKSERADFDQKLSVLFQHPELPSTTTPGFQDFKGRLDVVKNVEAANVVLSAAREFKRIQNYNNISPGGFSSIKAELLKSLDLSLPSILREDQAKLYSNLFAHFYTGPEHIYMKASAFAALENGPEALNTTQVEALRHYLDDSGMFSSRPGESSSYREVSFFPDHYASMLELVKEIDTPEKLALFKRFDENSHFRFDIRSNHKNPQYIVGLLDLIQGHPQPEKYSAVVAVADLLELEHNKGTRGSNMAAAESVMKRDDTNAFNLVNHLFTQIAQITPSSSHPSLRYDAFADLLYAARSHDGSYIDPNGVTRRLVDGQSFVNSSVNSKGSNFDATGSAITSSTKGAYLDSLKAVSSMFPYINRVSDPIDREIIGELALKKMYSARGEIIAVSPLWGDEVGKSHSESDLMKFIENARGKEGLQAYLDKKNPPKKKNRLFCNFFGG